MHCTENSKINDEMDGKEVIDLCSENQTSTSELHDGEESTKQEWQDKMKSKTISRMERKSRPEKDKLTAESDENKTAMMCWEKPQEESDNEGKKPIEKMQKPKDEEEHVDSTLHTKISIKEFSLENRR